MIALDDDLWRTRSRSNMNYGLAMVNNPAKGFGICHHATVSVTTGLYCGGYVQHKGELVVHCVENCFRILCRSHVGHSIDLNGTILIMDRGYCGGTVGEITQMTIDYGGNIHGTAKRSSSFPFVYGPKAKPNQHQKLLSEAGARCDVRAL